MTSKIHRREFLSGAAAWLGAAALPRPLSAAVPRWESPNERIALGMIGVGDLGYGHHLAKVLRMGVFDVVAVADPDQDHVDRAVQRTEGRAKGYRDYRHLLDRRDIDAVLIATPDHWHALTAVHACQAGKDVYCEKPLSLTIADGQAMTRAARRYGRVFQTGTQQRSDTRFRWACELVRNQVFGRVTEVDVCLGKAPTASYVADSDPPASLDWDLWLGRTPMRPYNRLRCHYNFRWFFEYSGGKLTDWGAHHLDIVQWALGTELGGPTSVEGTGVFPADNFYEVPVEFDVRYGYPGGVTVRVHGEGENGVTFRGSEGALFVSRSTIRAEPEEILDVRPGGGKVVLPVSRDHHRNWVDCIKSREQPISDVEKSHRSATVCHLGNIAIRLGRRLAWDPAKEEFPGDEAANRLRQRPIRGEWRL
ncbi:MAG: Gfo/Idh/MocA family oxidoreductase [Planctomycetota bacterium]